MKANSTNLNDLNLRVARLEVQNRRWKLVTGGFGLLAVSLLLVAAKPADTSSPALR